MRSLRRREGTTKAATDCECTRNEPEHEVGNFNFHHRKLQNDHRFQVFSFHLEEPCEP
jgi:hypothetical protein